MKCVQPSPGDPAIDPEKKRNLPAQGLKYVCKEFELIKYKEKTQEELAAEFEKLKERDGEFWNLHGMRCSA